MKLVGLRRAEELQYGRRNIEQARGLIHSTYEGSRCRRPVDDQGYPKRALINEITVSAFAVVAEALTVIGSENYQRSAGDALLDQEFPELPQHAIDVAEHCFIIQTARARLNRSRKPVGGVQVVEVEEEEKGRARVLTQPLSCSLGDVRAQALDFSRVSSSLSVKVERALVDVKPLAQSEASIQDKGAHKGCRTVSAQLQNSRKGNGAGSELLAVVFDPVRKGISRGQQGNVGGQSERRLRADLREQGPAPGHGVDVRRLRAPRAVATEAVGAQGVDRDENDRS